MAGFDRRSLLAGAAASLLLSSQAALAGAPERLLDKAIRRAGGRRALSRVRVLRWEGEAKLHVEGRGLALGVSTAVVPFEWARSTSWIPSDGPSKARTMIITRDNGWGERNGRAEPFPAAMVAHERAQSAIYGLMLLAPLEAPEVTLRAIPGGILAEHPRAPATELLFDAAGDLIEARNEVPDPGGGPPVPQRFLFSQEKMPGPVRWPRRFTLEQRGKPYFELTFSRFEAASA